MAKVRRDAPGSACYRRIREGPPTPNRGGALRPAAVAADDMRAGDGTMRNTTRLGVAALVLLGAVAGADAKGTTLAQLQALAAGTGYAATTDGKNYVSIPDQGKSKQTIFLLLSDGGTVMNVYTPFDDIPDDKKPAIPYEGLLRANNDGPFSFALHFNDAGHERVDLQGFFDASTVTKPMLKKTVDAFAAEIDATEPLWNQTKWAAPAAVAAVPAPAPAPVVPAPAPAKAVCEASDEHAPLTAQNATLVTQPAGKAGDIAKRPDAPFKVGDTVQVYLEPAGFTCEPLGAGRYKTDVAVDAALLAGNAVVWEKKDFLPGHIEADVAPQVMFYNMKLGTTGLAAGDYTLRFMLNDKDGGRSSMVTFPLKMLP